MVSLVFFLATVLLFQTVTFSPIALAQSYLEDTNIPSSPDKQPTQLAAIFDQLDDIMNKCNARIPSYVKNIFVFWEEGLISDSEVANAIKFLIEANIITSTSSPDKQPRQLAAIIDQLHDSIPNKSFQQKALEYLENAGYDVDVYTTEDITVDFYKKLPSMNYKFIYIRTHSLEEVTKLQNSTFLFTGEKYNVTKYIREQLSGQVARGIPIYEQELMELQESNELSEDKMYFVVGSKMINELMVGKFPQTVIVIGGCESIRSLDLAESLVFRGASVVIGWDRTIGSMENDLVMLALLEEVLINKIGIHDGIVSVMQEFGQDLQYSSKLNYLQAGR